ncbi:MAG: DUF6338 family protein [Marinosulfonomonas sp.]|nr:DUF6338 family protein [Marinosulfonomonas sp.]
MDFALAQLALIFMPGIIWANIDAKYGAGPKPQQSVLIMRAFLFGMATYSALFLIYSVCGQDFGYASLASDPKKVDLFKLKDEIAWSIPLSFLLSIGWLYVVNNQLLARFVHWIKASQRYGDEDVWSFTLNSSDAAVEYVHFRDLENGYIFAGWVRAYSENEGNRELLLRDVIVYDDKGTKISTSPRLYISRAKNNIWMEFPYNKEGYKDDNEKTNNSRGN